jgi:hypothetical protein
MAILNTRLKGISIVELYKLITGPPIKIKDYW